MKRILIIAPVFVPGYNGGGPIRSIYNIVQRLGDEFSFSILTSDRDLGDQVPYPGIIADQWIGAHGARIRYCSPRGLTFKSMARILSTTPHDTLYLNSFFSPTFSISPLIVRRMGTIPSRHTIMAPRGEFSPGALDIKSRKKNAYLSLGRASGLFNNLHWHASTHQEASDIRKTIGQDANNISIASNLGAILPESPPGHQLREAGMALRLVFLSRISPKKNLEFALRVLENIHFPVDFSIVGPEEDSSYSQMCRSIANSLPTNINVRWVGPAVPEQIPQIMANHDMLILPTLGENFGHVVAEALGAGTPVLLSDTTPWRGLIDLGIGYDLPLSDISRFRDALTSMWKQSPEEAAAMRARSFNYARKRQQGNEDVHNNRRLFLEPKPNN